MSGRQANQNNKASLLFREEIFKSDFNEFLDFYNSQTGSMCGEFKLAFQESAMLGLSQS
jgi:hypothetical protein